MKLVTTWIVVVLVCGCAGAASPRGESGVSTKAWVADHDESVVDVLSDTAGARRRVPVRAYFPSGAKGTMTAAGAIAEGAGPVLIFMHGTNGELDAHDLLARDLASQGWVVIVGAHPGLARTADYPNAPSRPISSKLQAAIAKLAGAPDTLPAVFADPFMQQTLELLRADIRLIVASAPEQLPGVSFERISYGGHSMGAIVTMGVCREASSRCVAFVNLDGPPADVSLSADRVATLSPQPVDRPSLVMTSELMETGANTRVFWDLLNVQHTLGTAPLLAVQLKKGGHLDLTDAPVVFGHVLQGVLFGAGAAGSIDPIRAVDVTRTTVSTFLQRYGRCDGAVALPGSLADLPELEVKVTRALDAPCR